MQPFPPSNQGAAECQYLDLVHDIMEYGYQRGDRTGVGTRSLHGATMRFDLSDGSIPLLTTKFVPLRVVVGELLWFLAGETNIRPLVQQNIHIWSDWPYQRYMKERDQAGCKQLTLKEFETAVAEDEVFARRWGDLGPVYGKQWRAWEGLDGRHHDQISTVLEDIQTQPESRRLIFTGWNVAELDQMALPPCHLLYQFFVAEGRLSLTLYQRSCDMGLGVPFNIVSAALIVRMMAQQAGLAPGELWWVGHDVHVYNNHIQVLNQQLQRQPVSFPKLDLLQAPDLFSYQKQNFVLKGYHHASALPMPVAV